MSWIIAASRSAVVPHNGSFAALSLPELAAPVVCHALAQADLAGTDVGELILSNALGLGGNPARSVSLAAGLPESIAGLSVDRQCAGGLDALQIGDAMIRSGLHDVVIVGGVETASRRPVRMRTFADGRPPEPYDQAPFTPWPDRDPNMIAAADDLADKLGITRQAQDAWAIESHRKALAAKDTFAPEICVIENIKQDAFTRNLTPKLADRAPALVGSITAANMAVSADASAFVVMVSDRIAQQIRGGVKLVGTKTLGGDPTLPGLAPVAAIQWVLSQENIAPSDLYRAEIMEAFAVQAIACQQQAHLPETIVNAQGGALARGHPIGASGAILAVSLFHQLRGTGQVGLAAIAAAGGIGTAALMRG